MVNWTSGCCRGDPCGRPVVQLGFKLLHKNLLTKAISYIIYPPSSDGGYSLEHTFVRLGMFDSYQSIYIRDAIELPPALAGGKYYYTRILWLKPISYIIYPPSEDGGYSFEHTFVRLGMFDSYQSIYIRSALELPPASAGGKHQSTRILWLKEIS